MTVEISSALAADEAASSKRFRLRDELLETSEEPVGDHRADVDLTRCCIGRKDVSEL